MVSNIGVDFQLAERGEKGMPGGMNEPPRVGGGIYVAKRFFGRIPFGRIKKEYMTYVVGSLIFLGLAGLTFYVIFRQSGGVRGLLLWEFISWTHAGILLGLVTALYAFDGLRLLFVFKTIGQDVSYRLMIRLVFINIFASGVTPLATGGGFAQIYFLGRNEVPLGVATAATTIRTVLASLMIFVSVPIILVSEKGVNSILPVRHGTLFALLLILFYGLIIFGIIRYRAAVIRLIGALVGLLQRMHLVRPARADRMKEFIEKEVTHFTTSLRSFQEGQKLYRFFSILSAAVYLLLLFSVPFVLLEIMNQHVHWGTVISLQVLITFLLYFTPTPGGSGVAEGGFALIFAHFISHAYVASLTFYWRFLTVYLGMIIGLYMFYREIWSKRRVGKS
jgi:hypothetical protein